MKINCISYSVQTGLIFFEDYHTKYGLNMVNFLVQGTLGLTISLHFVVWKSVPQFVVNVLQIILRDGGLSSGWR